MSYFRRLHPRPGSGPRRVGLHPVFIGNRVPYVHSHLRPEMDTGNLPVKTPRKTYMESPRVCGARGQWTSVLVGSLREKVSLGSILSNDYFWDVESLHFIKRLPESRRLPVSP